MNPHNRSDMKYHLLIFLFLTAIACHPATRKKTTASYTPIEVETIHIDSSDFDMCSMAECPPVRVDYIHFQGESRRAEEIKDRKSTRLNSSHVAISYAVFYLKQNKKLYGKK